MRPRAVPLIAALAGLLALGCAEKPAVNVRDDNRTEPSRGEVVRIVFELPGDDIGSQEDRALLEALKEAIVDNEAGEIVSSGYGMGTMELVVAVDGAESAGILRGLVGETFPDARYRIVAVAPESVQAPDGAGRRP